MTARGHRLLLAALVAWNVAACGWFATSSLHAGRFWDERLSIPNVGKVLVEGTLRAENGWYGRLSYLPQAALLGGARALYRLAGADPPELFLNNGDFTPPAYLVSRLVSVLYGAGALVLTFAVGRRIFSPETALLGTALLASTPWMLRHFATFKPDALVVLLALAAFYWSLDASDRRGLGRFALAGLGVGLAASAKLTGALAIIPILAAALAGCHRFRAALAWLAAAGAAATATFLIVHPDLGFYLHFLRVQDQIYALKSSHSFGSMLRQELSYLLHWSFHGWWLGVIAIAGLAALAVRLVRLVRADGWSPRARRLALFLSFPLGFSLAYALATSWPKGNNYLVIVPFTSLAAAWLLVTLWRLASARIPAAARRPVLWLALGGVLLTELGGASGYVYSQNVATTLELALRRVREASPRPSLRRAVFESEPGRDLRPTSDAGGRKDVLMVRTVTALSELPEAELDLADFESFTEERLARADAGFYRRRVERLDASRVARLRPAWFRAVGPPRLLLMHPWSRRGRPLPVEWRRGGAGKGRPVGRLPRGLRAGQIVSLEARLPRRHQSLAGVSVGGLELPMVSSGRDRDGERLSTPRFVLPRANLRVKPKRPGGEEPGTPPRIVVLRWTRESP